MRICVRSIYGSEPSVLYHVKYVEIFINAIKPTFTFTMIVTWCCSNSTYFFFLLITSVDTEMCCPKGKCGCQYFLFLTLKKKKSWTQGSLIFLIKKLILDYYFFIWSCVFISNFQHSPLPLPRDIKLYH
jgi:hypothetical protein